MDAHGAVAALPAFMLVGIKRRLDLGMMARFARTNCNPDIVYAPLRAAMATTLVLGAATCVWCTMRGAHHALERQRERQDDRAEIAVARVGEDSDDAEDVEDDDCGRTASDELEPESEPRARGSIFGATAPRLHSEHHSC